MNRPAFHRILETLLLLSFASLPLATLRADDAVSRPQPEAVREAFLKIIDRPKVDAAPELAEPAAAGEGIVQFHFTYASDAKDRVPGIIVKPTDAGKHALVIILHGTGGKKESEVGLLKQFAGKGFFAVAIDGRYHGERGTQVDYNAAIEHAFKEGGEHPLYYDTVWDIMRLIDYLQTRPDVDASRIGMMGFSKGGIETYFTAAMDPRVTVAVPCIGMQCFQWALDHDGWHGRVGTISKGFNAALKDSGLEKADAAFVQKFYDRVVPGIYNQFDGPMMIRLIAPRPLLIINGEIDDKTPLEGVNVCADAAHEAYANATDKFQRIIEPKTGHAVTKESAQVAMAWLEKWLKN